MRFLVKALTNASVFIASFLMLVCGVGCGTDDSTQAHTANKHRAPKSVSISFSTSVNPWLTLTMTLSDPSVINELFLDPVRKSTADEQPGEYIVVGDAVITYTDGTVDTLTLFYPLGRFEQDGLNYIADFSELKSRLSPDVRNFCSTFVDDH